MASWAMYMIGHVDFVTIGLLLFVLGIMLIQNTPHRRPKELLFLAAFIALPGEGLAATIASSLSHLVPGKIDLYICRIDSYFGYPGFRAGQFVHAHSWASLLVSASYSLIGSAMLFTFAYYLWRRSEGEALTVAVAFMLNLFAAIPIYLLFPVCGPQYAFNSFPTIPQHLASHLITLSFPPNGVPSVHTSIAILTLWFLRDSRIGRIIGITFLSLTIFATLGSGEHYFFDLLCAIPYAVLIIRISALLSPKTEPIDHHTQLVVRSVAAENTSNTVRC